VADPTGFAKKGTKSVAYSGQYSGTLGGLTTVRSRLFWPMSRRTRDRVLLDRRLYLPRKSWMADPARCAEAGVHRSDVRDQAGAGPGDDRGRRAAGVPFAWFTADEEFAGIPGLCDYLQESRIPYVMVVPKNHRFIDTGGTTVQFDVLAGRLRPNAWQRRACGIGSKGFRVYDWVLMESVDPDHRT